MAGLNELCAYFKSEGFHYLESWIKECVDYFKTNNPSISLKDLKDEVRQQWLLLNLRDIKVAAFPPNLKSQPKIILPGKYAVQVETLIDSGQSAYSQFQSLKKLNCENVKISAKPYETENTPRRCLTMKVTDGVQDLSAMEYDIIPGLKLNDPDFLPGFKMVIKGPVMCRRGMLMLKPENVLICGGEVDTLAQSNSYYSTLAGVLNKNPSEQDATPSMPQNNNQVFDDDDLLTAIDDELLTNVPIGNAIKHSSQESAILARQTEPVPSTRQQQQQGVTNHRRNSPLLSHQCEVLLIDEDPFGGEDDILLNIPDGFGAIASEPRPITSYDNIEAGPQPKKKKEIDANKKQTSISQYFSNSSREKSTVLPIPQNVVSAPKLLPASPFVYLSQIVRIRLKSDCDFNVKAVILTLKSKISIKDDKFVLKAKICDGSLSLDVIFSTEILEDFLGFSPCEMIELKSTNRNAAERLKTSFASMQSKLISLNAILCIRFFLDKRIPLVVSLQEVTLQHLNALRARESF